MTEKSPKLAGHHTTKQQRKTLAERMKPPMTG